MKSVSILSYTGTYNRSTDVRMSFGENDRHEIKLSFGPDDEAYAQIREHVDAIADLAMASIGIDHGKELSGGEAEHTRL